MHSVVGTRFQGPGYQNEEKDVVWEHEDEDDCCRHCSCFNPRPILLRLWRSEVLGVVHSGVLALYIKLEFHRPCLLWRLISISICQKLLLYSSMHQLSETCTVMYQIPLNFVEDYPTWSKKRFWCIYFVYSLINPLGELILGHVWMYFDLFRSRRDSGFIFLYWTCHCSLWSLLKTSSCYIDNCMIVSLE